jgi:histidyl-tRNA synthetase
MEAFALKSKISSSIGGGGRYDDMIGSFKGNIFCPASGFSFGLDTIVDVLKEKVKNFKQSVTTVFIIPIKTFKESLQVTQELRSNGINAEVDLMDKNISKNLDYANKKSIPFVVFFGNDELKKKRVKLRDMKSGKEELITVKELIKKVTNL